MDHKAQTPPNCRIYAVGDIHGRVDLLARLQGMIEVDAAPLPPGVRRLIVYLGDYIDRGPESEAVIERLIAGPPPGFEAVYLKGNHDDMLLRYLNDGALAETWMMNGGMEALESYGIEVPRPLPPPAWHDGGRQALARALPAAHLDFFRGLKLLHSEGDYLFVHAGVRPEVALDRQQDVDLMWIRHDFLESGEDFGKVVVHGHSITLDVEFPGNRIGIDTGAYHTGQLTALVLQDAEHRLLRT